MNKLLVVTIAAIIVLGIIGTAMMLPQASYATDTSKKQSKQAPLEETTVQPERQFQQPSGASEETTVQPERQLQFSPEQQEDENNAIELKDEQIRDVQEEEDDNENTGGNEEQVVIDKAPVVISGNNVYIVWFNDQNPPNNNSEALFRSSADGGITFADKINLSNTTAADSINAEIAADGSNFIVTWWEHNATSVEPVIRVSADSGATFVPILSLSADGTIGETVEEG
jgi:hypothetical protein